MGTVADYLISAADRWATRTWLVEDGAGRDRTVRFGEAAADVASVSRWLLSEFGVRPGDRIALSVGNRYEWLLAWFAASWLGASVVPINTALKRRGVEFIVGDCGARVWVVDESSAVGLKEAESIVKGLSDASVSVIPVEALAQQVGGWSKQRATEPYAARPEDEVSVLYTSGTTGNPKGCVCSHEYYAATGTRLARHLEASEEDRWLTCLPLFHMNAQTTTIMPSLIAGTSVILQDRFHAGTFMQRVVEQGVTIFNYIGTIPSILMEQEPSAFDRSHVMRVAFGGGIPPERHDAFERRFGFPCLEGYGTTECGATLVTPLHGDRKVGSGACGYPYEGVQVTLVDEEGREVQGAGAGQLLVRGEGLFRGYLSEEQSAAAFDDAGWFWSGDVLSRDQDGCYYFVDRSRDMIRRAGENISPREIEAVISGHPACAEAAVIGVPDQLRGEEVCAFVRLQSTDTEREELRSSIFEHLDEHLAYFQVPRFLVFVEEFPRTPTERIRKEELRAYAQGLIERGDVTGR